MIFYSIGFKLLIGLKKGCLSSFSLIAYLIIRIFSRSFIIFFIEKMLL